MACFGNMSYHDPVHLIIRSDEYGDKVDRVQLLLRDLLTSDLTSIRRNEIKRRYMLVIIKLLYPACCSILEYDSNNRLSMNLAQCRWIVPDLYLLWCVYRYLSHFLDNYCIINLFCQLNRVLVYLSPYLIFANSTHYDNSFKLFENENVSTWSVWLLLWYVYHRTFAKVKIKILIEVWYRLVHTLI